MGRLIQGFLSQYKDADAIVIDGFPRNKMQVERFNTFVSGEIFV